MIKKLIAMLCVATTLSGLKQQPQSTSPMAEISAAYASLERTQDPNEQLRLQEIINRCTFLLEQSLTGLQELI